MIGRNKWIRIGGALVRPAYVGVSQEDIQRSNISLGEAKALSDIFANRRAAFGYDILLGRLDRDRSAADFAFYLDDFRHRYAPNLLQQAEGGVA